MPADDWTSVLGVEGGIAFRKSQKFGLLPVENAVRVELPGCEVYNYYDQGVSITLVDGRVDSVDFYFRNHSYTPCKLELPYSISDTATGVDLVRLLGEPKEKGGGIGARINVWMRWDGIQIEMDTMSWETAPKAHMKALTIFVS